MMIKTFFRNTLRIYTTDLRKICRNWVSLVVLGGLVLLPSLYAWINIYASWDPYGNTKGIKVGIVNQDKGSQIKEIAINIGEEVTKSLKENKSLGWIFFETEEEGIEEVNLGQIYATIIIPEDFSEKMASLLNEKVEKPELEYYVNEKINAIAPKITDKGASTIQQEITISFIETVANQVLEMMQKAGIELNKEYPNIEKLEHILYDLNDNFPEISKGINYLGGKVKDGKVIIDRQDQNIVALQETIHKVSTFNEELTNLLEELGIQSEQMIPQVKENLVLIQTIFKDISSSTLSLGNEIELDKPMLIKEIDETINKIESIKRRVDEVATKAVEVDYNLAEAITVQKSEIINTLEEYINILEELKNNIDKPEQLMKLLQKAEQLNVRLAEQLKQLRIVVEKMQKEIDENLAKVQKILEKIENIALPKSPEIDTEGTVQSEETSEHIDTQEEEEGQIFIEQVDEVKRLVDEVKEKLDMNTEMYQEVSMSLAEISQILSQIKEDGTETQIQSLDKLKNQARALSTIIQDIRIRIENKIDGITEKLNIIEEMLRDVANVAKGLQNLIGDLTDMSQERINHVIEKIEEVEERLIDMADQITGISEKEAVKIDAKAKVVQEDLAALKEKLINLQVNLADKEVIEETLRDVTQLTYNIGASLENIIDKLDQNLINKLKQQMGEASIFIGDINGILSSIQEELDDVRVFEQKLASKSVLLASDIAEIQDKLPNIQEKIGKVVNKIKELNEKVDIKKIIKQITMDNSDKSNFLASPVILNTHVLYPMANYGAAMTPFYTTLCLWVGALLLTALLTTKAKNTAFEYTPVQEYFGKYLLFATLAAMQGFIAATGDILVLGVEAKQPILLVVLAVCYSIIFTGIVYTLVSLFGNVGKAIGVVLLVLQLAGAGGTFPVQVMPEFFQKINCFLPFTYAIGGMREAIAGVAYEALVTDIVMLIGFFLVFIIIGVLLKKKANTLLHKFAKKLGEAGVIEH